MTGKRNLFLGLLIGLVLGGALPAFLSFHDWTSAQDSRTVLLRQGWNQLVWTADNQPADTALAAIAGDLVIVYGWQGDSQTFTRYIPDRADVSTMGEVEKNSGYWLLMTREVVFSFPTADIQCPACPAPTPCPQCPEPTDSLLAEYLLSDACTSAKLNMELGDITGEEKAESEAYFNANCQSVALLEGSPLTEMCATAGVVSAGVAIPGKQFEGIQAVVLVDRYCLP